MIEVEYLDLDDLLEFVRRLRAGPVRDVGLLASAAARPQTTVMGEDAYPALYLKAAALLDSIVRHHPLVDGNKRLGWLAAAVFLDLNGAPIDRDDDVAFDLVMAVAEGRLDVPRIAEQLS